MQKARAKRSLGPGLLIWRSWHEAAGVRTCPAVVSQHGGRTNLQRRHDRSVL